MFNFFKKKTIYLEPEKKLLFYLSESLKNRFPFIYNQIKEGIIVDIFEKDKFRKFVLDVDLLNKYENKKGNYFSINKIFLFDKILNDSCEINLEIGYGAVIGYSYSNINLIKNFSNSVEISLKSIEIESFNKVDFKINFTKEEINFLATNDIYEIELNNNIYYHIFDLEDGDFVCVDINKNVYKVFHDPFEIIFISDNLLSYLNQKIK